MNIGLIIFIFLGTLEVAFGWMGVIKASNSKRDHTRIYSSSNSESSTEKPRDILELPINAVKKSARISARVLSANPIARIFTNTYNFWYWLPKRNMPYDAPWMLFRNSTVEWIAWYQFPHNLPPYRYLPVDSDGEFGGYRDDFFCYGLPGNTLPLGNWDPAGFQLVNKNVVLKYRESELKHGRLAMLASLGFLVQEVYHPFHPSIAGLSITHMAQLRDLPPSHGAVGALFDALQRVNVDPMIIQALDNLPLDYIATCSFLAVFEILALKRNWVILARDEYNHQFDHNIGLGNLRGGYENGNYSFDPLGLNPKDPTLRREVQESELNHGRLAMIAIIGMIFQEYLTGLPPRTSLGMWFGDSSTSSLDAASFIPAIMDSIMSFPTFIQRTFQSLQTKELEVPM